MVGSRANRSSRGKKPLAAGGTDYVAPLEIERLIPSQEQPPGGCGPRYHRGATLAAQWMSLAGSGLGALLDELRSHSVELLLNGRFDLSEGGIRMRRVPRRQVTLNLMDGIGWLGHHRLCLSWWDVLYSTSHRPPCLPLFQKSTAHSSPAVSLPVTTKAYPDGK